MEIDDIDNREHPLKLHTGLELVAAGATKDKLSVRCRLVSPSRPVKKGHPKTGAWERHWSQTFRLGAIASWALPPVPDLLQIVGTLLDP